MLADIHPKYTLSVYHQKYLRHNPVHNTVDGSTATVIDLTVGKRGWIAYCFGPDDWHRLHTSTVQDVVVDAYGNIEVTTLNTVYRLNKLIEDNK